MFVRNKILNISEKKEEEQKKRKSTFGSSSLADPSDAVAYKEKAEIFSMIRSRMWDKLRRILRSKRGKIICSHKDSSDLNILGMVLGLRPPTDIVELICSLNPRLVLESDMFGALPLHVACLNGISVEILDLLVAAGGDHTIRSTDKDNRCVLHHAVEYICLLFKEEDSAYNSSLLSMIYEESLEVVEHILSIFPEAVHCKTDSGDSPLDIVHFFKLKWATNEHPKLDELYRILQATCVDLYRKSKIQWEKRGYNTGTKKESFGVPSMESSVGSSIESTSRADVYHELEKMSLCSERSQES